MKVACSAFLAVLALVAASTSAAEPPTIPTIDKIEVGFQGKYKLGYWTNVHVTLSTDEYDPNAWLEVTVLDGDGVPCTCRASSDGGSFVEDLSREVLIKPGRLDTPFIVTLRTKDRVLTTRTFRAPEVPAPLQSSQQLYLTLFANDEELLKRIPQPREEMLQAQVVAMVPGNGADGDDAILFQTLPADPAAYECLDGILLNYTCKHASFLPLSFRTMAIFMWAHQGGKLVICANQCAEHAQETFKSVLPIHKFSESVTLRKATAIEHYADIPSRDEFGDGAGVKNLDLPVPRLTNVTGKIECYDGVRPTDLPLVIRQPFGFGEIVFVPLDWDAPPIAGWSGRGYFFDKLFRRNVNPAEKSGDFAGSFGQAGYDDLSGQLRSALDEFPGVTPIPFWAIALWMVGYLAVIGAFDYYVVHRVFQRMQVAWLTFPIYIAMFCGLAYWLSEHEKGNVIRVRQVDLVDADLDAEPGVWKDSPRGRGTSWFQVFSPRSDVFNLSIETPMPERERRLAWLGLPGSALGGMSVSSGESLDAAFSQGYEMAPPGPTQEPALPPSFINRFPISIASSRSLVAHYDGKLNNAPTMELHKTRDGNLVGGITINGLTPLEDCVLFYERAAYKLGRIEPGKPFTLDDRREPDDIESYLNRRKLQGDKIVATPYDPFDTDPRRILDMMMFYEAAGGRSYTHLLNRYQSELDLSEQLVLGRAILVGRTSVPAATLLRDGQPLAQPDDEHVTFVRYVFSVKD